MDLSLHPALSGRLARIKAILELLDYMSAKGGMRFARLDRIVACARLIAEGRWTPRYETFPLWEGPPPNSPKTGEQAGARSPHSGSLLQALDLSDRWFSVSRTCRFGAAYR